jgi:signal transduction histidine kinase
MRMHALIPFVAAAANLLVCVPVVRQRGRQPIHWAFAWMTLSIAAWNLGIFSLEYFRDPLLAEHWSRIFRTGICFAPVAGFHFALVQSGERGRRRSALLHVGYALATLLAVANLAGLLVSGVRPHEWGWYPEPTRLYAGVTALVLVYVGLMIERVYDTFRHPESARQRTQAKFWVLALVVQVPFVVTNLLPIYGVNVYPLGNLGNVLFTGIIAYAIVRHRLMEVDYVVRKFVSFSLAACVVFLPGGTAFALLYRTTDGSAAILVLCAALALALVATVAIPVLQQALETRLQRALFPARDDYRARLRRLTGKLVHVLERAPLLAKLGRELEDILEVERCEVFARHDESDRWLRIHPALDATAPPAEVVEALADVRVPVLGVELEATSERAAATCRARGWEVVLPLRLRESLTAIVLIGPNKHFRLFAAEDLQLLTTIAASASVALENARLSAQLRRSEKVLEQSSRLSSLGMLAAGIAHEIRNPLSAVKTFLDLLPERLEDRDFLTDFRNMSLSELRRVTNLISDLLALGKSSAAKHAAVDLAPTLEPVIRLMESTARKRRIEVQFSNGGAVPVIFANADQLKQITLNLILNAIDASPPGANIAVRLHATEDGQAMLEVVDEGSGIPAETLDHIFDPFYTTKETGTGLGLALVYQMVREHGGDISVESMVGRGTAFRVVLPAAGSEFQGTGTDAVA